ncbi:hypothetical protein GTZ99_10595 [Novosphingobium sp. FSY-8]|uniref:Uncharacterized protein n=1 Tax=Novosphingobium ovatum TaxID=1908523 RepID=A0ABW9XEP0_9SPHN|nr:hypothetical protein [Novosphingobium ovatum]NBC37004.1 hypothetical protein [Novosphingobium ovatum]
MSRHTRPLRLPACLFALGGALLLSACAGDGGGPGSTPRPQPHPQPRPHVVPPVRVTPPPAPRVLSAPGLEGVIGAGTEDLIRQFGVPRLDVTEGDARKLQFGGSACVLDIYLYPPQAGAAPRATYVEARRATDAREVDRAACVAALRRG